MPRHPTTRDVVPGNAASTSAANEPLARPIAPTTALTRQSANQSALIMSVDEILDRYHGEWILLRTTASELGWPTHGEVLAHSKRRATVEKRLDALLPALRASGARHTIFQAYPRITSGAEMMELLDNVESLDLGLRLR